MEPAAWHVPDAGWALANLAKSRLPSANRQCRPGNIGSARGFLPCPRSGRHLGPSAVACGLFSWPRLNLRAPQAAARMPGPRRPRAGWDRAGSRLAAPRTDCGSGNGARACRQRPIRWQAKAFRQRSRSRTRSRLETGQLRSQSQRNFGLGDQKKDLQRLALKRPATLSETVFTRPRVWIPFRSTILRTCRAPEAR